MPFKRDAVSDFDAAKTSQLGQLKQDSDSALATFDIAVAQLRNINQEIDKSMAEIDEYIASLQATKKQMLVQKNANIQIINQIEGAFGSNDDSALAA